MPEMKTLNGYEIVDEKAREEKVGFTDYATGDKAGVVRIYAGGLMVGDKGKISINKATDTEINYKGNEYKPIVPKNLDYAVKMGLTANKLTLTDDEKKSAQAWLGIDEYHPLPQWITMSNEMAAQNEATLPYKISKPTAIKCWFIEWDDEAINREDLDFNVSNISWNGDKAYIEQHGEIFKIEFEIRDYGGGSIFTVMTFGCETNGNVVFDNYSPIEVYAIKEN